MEDFRLFYAAETLEPEQAKELPAKLLKDIAKEPVRSVRPDIPEELEYIGTRFYGNICFDYYRLPDGTYRQEYRKKYQKIITRYLPGGKRHEKNQKRNRKNNLHSVSGDADMDSSERSGHERPQSDGPAVSEMEHDCNTGEGCTGATKRGNFSMLPA